MYDYTLSTHYRNTSTASTSVHYGTGRADGYRSLDLVCMDSLENACTDSLQILAVYETSGLEGMQSDGIVGLAPESHSSYSLIE